MKEASHFYKNVTRCSGLSPECKVCRLHVQRANQASHKLKNREAWTHRNSTAKLAQRQQQKLSGSYHIHRERDRTSRRQKKLLQPYWELGRQKPKSAFQTISKRIPQHQVSMGDAPSSLDALNRLDLRCSASPGTLQCGSDMSLAPVGSVISTAEYTSNLPARPCMVLDIPAPAGVVLARSISYIQLLVCL